MEIISTNRLYFSLCLSQSQSCVDRNKEEKIAKICRDIKQYFVFTEHELSLFEARVNDIVLKAENEGFEKFTVDRALLRNK